MRMENIEKEEVFKGYLTEEERQKLLEKGEKSREEEIVKNLLKLGQPIEIIAKATNMSKKQINTLATTIL